MLYIIPVLLLILVLVFAYKVMAFLQRDRKTNLLANLGLVAGLQGGVKSPYYKWAWRKGSGDRVWGERIVREAFDQANVGLSQEDMEFFKKTCDAYAQGKAVDKAEIVKRVYKIYDRSASVSNIAIDYIRPNLDEALSLSPNKAKATLDGLRIHATIDTALGRLATHKFGQILQKIGAAIIQPNGTGFEVKNKEGNPIMTLKGFEGWQQWLKAVRAAAQDYIDTSPLVKKTGTTRYLKTQIINNIMVRYSDDIKKSQNFVKSLSKTASQEGLHITEAEILKLERIFYFWHLSDGNNFSLNSLNEVRNFLNKPEFNPYFREIIIRSITPFFDSLTGLISKFPVHVIFYGDIKEAREFASQQYALHLFHLNKLITDLLGSRPRPPLFVRLLTSDVEAARRGEFPMEYDAEEFSDRKNEDEEDPIKQMGHMPKLLEIHKKRTLFEKNMDEAAAEKLGWIIDLPVDEFTVQENAQLDMGNYLFYKRINCDKVGNPNFDNESNAARLQRSKYLGEIFNKIIGN